MKIWLTVLLISTFFVSCTSFQKNRMPNSTNLPFRIPIDVHQHYVPNGDGFLGAPHECAADQIDIEVWEKQKALTQADSQTSKFESVTPKPILGQMKKGCSADFPTVQEIVANPLVQHTLLISQTFEINENKAGKGNSEWSTIQNVEAINAHVSEMSLDQQDKLSGLCGLNYSWSNQRYERELLACEKMKGLVGYKFYWDEVTASTSPEATKNLESFFRILKGKKRIVLWHLDFPEVNGDPQDTKFLESYLKSEPIVQRFRALMVWATRNPHIHFIFAHGFYSTELMEGLFQFENSVLLQGHNIYFDLSAANTYMNLHQMQRIADVARRIGLWRFLFGTDGGQVEKVYAMYTDKFGFSRSEAERVIFHNGQVFLKNVLEPIKKERSAD